MASLREASPGRLALAGLGSAHAYFAANPANDSARTS